jgi:hypothetical protein
MAAMSDRGGWWGIAFVASLFVVAAMVSPPSAAQGGARIAAFYAAHRPVIVAQQVAGALALVPFFGFAAALDRRARARSGGARNWLIPAGLLLGVAQVATNLPALALAALADPAPATAHALALAEDLADAALFGTIAAFALAAPPTEPRWVRLAGLAVAALTLARAVASPLGVAALDNAAPLAFLAFVLLLSVRLLVADRPRRP